MPAPTSVASSALTVAEVLSDLPVIRLFTHALCRADMQELLRQPTAYTVFAPTDETIRDRYGDEDSLFDSPDTLDRLVRSHIIPGKFAGSYFNGRMVLRMLSGVDVEVDRSVFVDPDIVCCNGIVHVIDSILGPVR
jgi:uncharacterized surface protein with fasciclin (FAS1) repeats